MSRPSPSRGIERLVLRWVVYLRRIAAIYARGRYSARPRRTRNAPVEFRATQSKKASVALASHRFNYADVNNDGVVDLTEFPASRGGRTGGKPNKIEIFILCDADDSLSLDPEEYSDSLAATTPWTKVLKAFSKRDKDDNGVLSTREFGIRRFPL